MEVWQTKYITSKLPTLTDDTICNAQFWSNIKKSLIFSEEDVQIIKSKPTQKGQNYELYRLLPGRKQGYEVLIGALYHTKQSNIVEILLKGFTENRVPIPFKVCNIDIAQDLVKSTNKSWLLPIARCEATVTPISFQGTTTCLETLLENMHPNQKARIMQALDEGTIGSILNKDQQFVLAEKPVTSGTTQFYQNRTLTHTQKILLGTVFLHDTTSVFVFYGITEDQLLLLDILPNVVASDVIRQHPSARYVLLIDISHFDNVLHLRPNSEVYLVRFADSQFYLDYIQGDLEKLKTYIVNKTIETSQNELVNIFQLSSCSSINIIRSVPRMGKTELLKSLALELAKTNDGFTALLSFPEFIKVLKNKGLAVTISNIKRILNTYSSNTLTDRFKHTFMKEKLDSIFTKIYLCIDNLDKLHTKDLKRANDFFKLFESHYSNTKLIIATQSDFKPLLKWFVNANLFYINHFSTNDKLSMLTSIVSKNNITRVNARKCSEKVLHLVENQYKESYILTGFPEYCQVLGKVIVEVIGSKAESNFLIKNYKVIPFKMHYEILQNNFSLDEPIDQPYKVTTDTGKIFSCGLREVNMTYVIHLLAKSHFSFKPLSRKENVFIALAKNNEELIRSGLVQSDTCGNLEFVHKSILEFIFAHNLFKRLNDPSKKYGILFYIFNSLLCVIRTNVTIFEDMPHQEVISIPTFRFVGILYFLNYLIHENPFSKEQEEGFLEIFDNVIDPQYFMDILSASIYCDFRSIFEFCYMLYANRVVVTILPQSLHSFDPIRVAVTNATIDSFTYYWNALRDIGFDETHIQCFTDNTSPIRMAIHYGIYDIFTLLRRIYGKDTVDTMHVLHACTIGSVKCTDSEVISQRIQIIELMVKENYSLLQNDVMGEKNRTALLQPHTHIRLLKCLINEGADVNELTYSDNSVLHLALLKDQFEQVLTLQDFKILFRLLKMKRFKHFNKPNSLGYTPLHLLVKSLDEEKIDNEILTMFQNAGVVMNKPTGKGKHTLFLGTYSIKVFNLLLGFNSNTTTTDYRDRTLLHTAILHQNYEVVKRILSLRKEDELFINKQDENGDTAMHYAVRENTEHLKRIQLCLIAANANLYIENNAKHCAIVEAFRNWDSLTVSFETLKSMDESQYPINYSIASKCLASLVINPKFDFTCIKSEEYVEIFRYMIDKCKGNKIEFGCLNRRLSVNGFIKFLDEFVEENNAWSHLNPNELAGDSTDSENGEVAERSMELEKQILLSKTKASEYCYNLLKQRSFPLFYSFRQKLREQCDERVLFVKTPEHLDKILDSEIETLVYFTTNTRLLIQRLRDCLGQNILVYPGETFSFKTSIIVKEGLLLVNAGTNRQIFELHNQFRDISEKIVYVSSKENTDHKIPNALNCTDIICWSELSPYHQKTLKSKAPLFLHEENPHFSEDGYKSLHSNCLVDLISKPYLTLEVFCNLLNTFYLIDLTPKVHDNKNLVQRLICQKSLATLFPGQWKNKTCLSSELTSDPLYKCFVDEGILVEYSDLSGGTIFEFRTKFHCFWYIGRSLALNHFDVGDVSEKQKLYHRLFAVQIHNVYIRSLCDLLIRDCDDNSICVVCFEFTYPVLLYFYSKYSQGSSITLFSKVVGNTPKPYISACIRANLCTILKALFNKTPSWFQDEDFVFIAISCSNISTIKEVVRCFEESSKQSVRILSLGRNSEITPLHVAIKRGNYEVVDYVLNTLQFKTLLQMIDTPALFRYCVSFSKTNAVKTVLSTEVESRWDIFQLLLANVNSGGNNSSKSILNKIYANILVEVKNIHIDLIKLLVENGANVWDIDKRTGCNIAHLSPKYLNADEYLELVKFIIKQGSGQLFKSRNLSEESAVRCALRDLTLNNAHDEEKMCQILRLLNKVAGIQFNIPNKFHKTILHCAKEVKRSDKIINEIIKLGGVE